MSLIEKEKVYEKTLKALYGLSIGNIDIKNTDVVLRDLESTVREWDVLLNSNILSKTSKHIIRNIKIGKSTCDMDLQLRNLRLLYLVLAPLEHYMMGLEEMKADSFRDAVTRCGIVCERIVNSLLHEITSENFSRTKFNDRVGKLQDELCRRKIILTNHFCNRLSGIYNIRSTRGPHDVPCAEEIEAKDCIASMPLIYSRYLDILESQSYDLGKIKEDLTSFANNIVIFSTLLPTVGRGGKKPLIDDILTDLYRQSFFSESKRLSEIEGKLNEIGYNFRKDSVSHALASLCRKGILHRSGTRRKYTYSQKIPPTEYFE